MNEIGIDIETRSGESIKNGVYKYVESSDFKIILFAYSINGTEPRIIDLTANKLPEELLIILQSKEWLKTAHNAQFERVCINKHFDLNIPASQWHCTMVLCASLSLPLPLDVVSKVLKVSEKDRAGKDLIRYFSIKLKKPKIPGKLFNYPKDNPEKWERFKSYCIQDVRVEQEIRNKLKTFVPYNAKERQLYLLDQKINDYGVKINTTLAANAVQINKLYTAELENRAKLLTGVANPHSVQQLKAWIKQEIGIDTTLNKESKIDTDNTKVLQLLKLRKEMAKTSIKKYIAMLNAASKTDSRVRGLFQFGGASRTMRWAGRIAQPQNYPKNTLKDLDFVRDLVIDNDINFLKAYTDNINNVLSQLLRTTFIPEEGNTFLITDFSAIEARVLSWYAKEKWRLEVFNTHGKIYEASASAMFKVPLEQVTKGSDYRQKAKIAELALGYQGSIGALINAGAEKMGLTEIEMERIVYKWRKANPKIVNFWYTVERAALNAIQGHTKVGLGKLVFEYKNNCLFIWLPSGRPLLYLKAEADSNNKISYMGLHQKLKKWMRLPTYGGKFVENITQATARDILAEAMLKVDSKGYKIALHVHDEIVNEVPRGTAEQDLNIIDNIMSERIVWAEGLPLKGDSYLSDYYRKEN